MCDLKQIQRKFSGFRKNHYFLSFFGEVTDKSSNFILMNQHKLSLEILGLRNHHKL